MPASLTGATPEDTYNQLLHISDGPETTEKTVYSGTGVATALKLGTGSASVDNIKLDGNTISTTDTNGDLNLSPDGTGAVVASNVTITGGSITGITDLAVADGGTGASTASGARTALGIGTIGTQDSNNVTITGGTISGVTLSGGFTGITLLTSATLTSTSSMGYAAGAGGTVTQTTNRTTGVTVDKNSGAITLVSAAGSTSPASFTVTNSAVAATDTIILNQKSGTDKYILLVTAVAAGSFQITFYTTGGTTTEQPVINFNVIKGVTT